MEREKYWYSHEGGTKMTVKNMTVKELTERLMKKCLLHRRKNS